MKEGMSSKQVDAYLEQIAKLIESKAQSVAEAVSIIREAKIN